jgi:hypothetical protein
MKNLPNVARNDYPLPKSERFGSLVWNNILCISYHLPHRLSVLLPRYPPETSLAAQHPAWAENSEGSIPPSWAPVGIWSPLENGMSWTSIVNINPSIRSSSKGNPTEQIDRGSGICQLSRQMELGQFCSRKQVFSSRLSLHKILPPVSWSPVEYLRDECHPKQSLSFDFALTQSTCRSPINHQNLREDALRRKGSQSSVWWNDTNGCCRAPLDCRTSGTDTLLSFGRYFRRHRSASTFSNSNFS